jgi:hypothetical protein
MPEIVISGAPLAGDRIEYKYTPNAFLMMVTVDGPGSVAHFVRVTVDDDGVIAINGTSAVQVIPQASNEVRVRLDTSR